MQSEVSYDLRSGSLILSEATGPTTSSPRTALPISVCRGSVRSDSISIVVGLLRHQTLLALEIVPPSRHTVGPMSEKTSSDLYFYSVSRADRSPLVEFIQGALESSGCRLLHVPDAGRAPFRFTFETPEGDRMGIIAYAFLANSRPTKNRPSDEHRFQLKYGKKDGAEHVLWQDPFSLYTTLLVGIDLDLGLFVGFDPVLHSPTKFFISLEFKRHNADQILSDGWSWWERERRTREEPVEVVVGGRRSNFLRYVRFERDAWAESQGHRALVAERVVPTLLAYAMPSGAESPDAVRLHALAHEFQLNEWEVLDLIANARRLKMAVRGWVAEHHLVRTIEALPEVSECKRNDAEGQADVKLRFRGVPLTVECKNVLRRMTADGLPRLDFQRTRASKSDPCSRYYAPSDFDVVAACLHAVEEKWTFKFVRPTELDPHRSCAGKLSSNVRLDRRWLADATTVLAQAAKLAA
jgi:hypothetical protein